MITAHYGMEGDAFYGFDLARTLPYAISQTWHVQLDILSFYLHTDHCFGLDGLTMDGCDAETWA
ncbi:hypothetical protein H9X96_19740 [Pedobacter sp. N36a]|nr:hypothetical protein [Pedobacter sp. N36a]